jgi:hypothetical protein
LSTDVSIVLKKLLSNTEYEWKIRSICTDDTSNWAEGPHFTTGAAMIAGGITSGSDAQINSMLKADVMPNPNTGNFTVRMQLPNNNASTTIELFNGLGEKIWQDDLGLASGKISRNLYLENKLSAGVYILTVRRNDVQLSMKVVVSK